MCCLLLFSICVAALSGVFLGKSSIKMLGGSQKLKATDMANMCGFFSPLFSICVCSYFPFPSHYREDLEIIFLYVSPPGKLFIITVALTGGGINKVNAE